MAQSAKSKKATSKSARLIKQLKMPAPFVITGPNTGIHPMPFNANEIKQGSQPTSGEVIAGMPPLGL